MWCSVGSMLTLILFQSCWNNVRLQKLEYVSTDENGSRMAALTGSVRWNHLGDPSILFALIHESFTSGNLLLGTEDHAFISIKLPGNLDHQCYSHRHSNRSSIYLFHYFYFYFFNSNYFLLKEEVCPGFEKKHWLQFTSLKCSICPFLRRMQL